MLNMFEIYLLLSIKFNSCQDLNTLTDWFRVSFVKFIELSCKNNKLLGDVNRVYSSQYYKHRENEWKRRYEPSWYVL